MSSQLHIIEQCLQGDQHSCKLLYEDYMPYCYGICQRYGVPKSDIKDQIQIIFSATFRSLHTFDASKASFKTWFTRITINKILEEKRKNRISFSEDGIQDYHLNASYDDSNRIHDKIDRVYITKILSKMPSQYQSVFNLYIIDGYSHAEIAGLLNISVSNSRIILNRARNWAKEALVSFLKYS